jgi:glycosyltransferase involved in cell wall biosynthesis
MRVLITVPSLSGGGAEFVASQWACYLAQVGDHVTVYATHSAEEDLAPDGVSLVKARKGNVVAQTRDLVKYLKNQRVDIVVAVGPYANLMSIAAARSPGTERPRAVISQHSLVRGPRMAFASSHGRQQWLARRTYRYADLFVAVSHPVGAEAIAEYGLSAERVIVVPNPVLAKIQRRVVGRGVRHRDPDRLDIVVAGRLAPEKRPVLAVEVAATLSPAFPGGVAVHFFGLGPLREAVVSRAREAGVNVVMHGWVRDWFDECPAGAVLLITSVLEGFGNVLVEAAAAGFRSVVSSHCLGAADAVVPGITGELVAGNSAEDYAAAVLATCREAVGDVEPWLQRFSLESSGGILRDALLRTANHVGGIES